MKQTENAQKKRKQHNKTSAKTQENLIKDSKTVLKIGQ